MATKVEGILWLFSVLIRFVWTLFPQTGYIHPDEFFQSPEITAGDILGLQSLRTWEFNETFPVRSILFPHLTTGLPFWAMKWLFPDAKVSSTSLLILPRLVFCLISLAVDMSGYKIARALGMDPAPVVSVVGTSYTTIVFLTRPFSNSLESVLFALLLWVVTDDITKQHPGLYAHTWQKKASSFFIGVLVSAGFWNRPTFLGFALIPILSWLYNFCCDKIFLNLKLIQQIRTACVVVIPMVFGAFITGSIFISVDSIYFRQPKSGVVVTPLNFLKYNLDSSKIREHGQHPRVTHYLVNTPLLFGVLALCLYLFLICLLLWRDLSVTLKAMLLSESTQTRTKKNTNTDDKMTMIFAMLILSILVPIGLLSIMPHQEPRFILPVLLPLSVLFSHLIIGSKAHVMVTASWIIWNVLGCVIFGLLHQGGLTPCLAHLQQHLSVLNIQKGSSIHLVFSNTYMPPRHLLGWPVCLGNSKTCGNPNLTMEVHDLAGKPLEELNNRIEHIISSGKIIPGAGATNLEIFVICPSKTRFSNQDFVLIKQFFPHLSMEQPPDPMSLTCPTKHGRYSHLASKDKEYCERQTPAVGKGYWREWIMAEMSLNLYKYQPL